jgi:hypothetical protein
VVLDELTKDVDRQEADEAYIRGMSCILSNATDYLLSDELDWYHSCGRLEDEVLGGADA